MGAGGQATGSGFGFRLTGGTLLALLDGTGKTKGYEETRDSVWIIELNCVTISERTARIFRLSDAIHCLRYHVHRISIHGQQILRQIPKLQGGTWPQSLPASIILVRHTWRLHFTATVLPTPSSTIRDSSSLVNVYIMQTAHSCPKKLPKSCTHIKHTRRDAHLCD